MKLDLDDEQLSKLDLHLDKNSSKIVDDIVEKGLGRVLKEIDSNDREES